MNRLASGGAVGRSVVQLFTALLLLGVLLVGVGTLPFLAVEPALASSSQLASGATLAAGQSLYSPSQQYRLTMQTDGNVVLYAADRALWSTNTQGNPGARLVMQTDGNLVVYSSANRAVWNTGTQRFGTSSLVVQDDANVVVYTSARMATWHRMASSSGISNGDIYATANSYATGAWGGQCKVWVATVFNNTAARVGASARINSGTTYYGCYQNAGGNLVSSAAAARGDIIQLYYPGNQSAYVYPMHSAIVVDNLGGGNFNVIDSNWSTTNDELVRRHQWNPYSTAGSNLTVAIWRLGK